jgi:hypothetical protein
MTPDLHTTTRRVADPSTTAELPDARSSRESRRSQRYGDATPHSPLPSPESLSAAPAS